MTQLQGVFDDIYIGGIIIIFVRKMEVLVWYPPPFGLLPVTPRQSPLSRGATAPVLAETKVLALVLGICLGARGLEHGTWPNQVRVSTIDIVGMKCPISILS